MGSIYGLYDTSGALRYIGKANDPEKRLKGHMRDARRRRTPLYDWLGKHGVPELRIIEADCADWREAERRLIAEARSRGERLLNIADGGDEPHCSPEVRKANGVALSKRIASDPEFRRVRDMKRHMMTAIYNGYVRNATRAKLRHVAEICPSKFACFAFIPDRVEDENGMGLVKVGRHYVTA